MKKTTWIIIFFTALLANIAGLCFHSYIPGSISKPLIVPALIGYFITAVSPNLPATFKKAVIAALVFSWLGDVLLMFQPNSEIFFLLGLGSFLIAHLCYIVFFHQVRVRENIAPKPLLLIPVVLYYATLINILLPFLGNMKIPVLVYGVVISFMLLLAMHTLWVKTRSPGQWMMLGALLFVISDSILAINKFYQPFELAGVLIMLTYGMAQFFIVKGAVKYSV